MAYGNKGVAPSDGRGMGGPKATSKEASVEGQAAKNVPGGESGGSNWIDMEGPNPGTGLVKTPKTMK